MDDLFGRKRTVSFLAIPLLTKNQVYLLFTDKPHNIAPFKVLKKQSQESLRLGPISITATCMFILYIVVNEFSINFVN